MAAALVHALYATSPLGRTLWRALSAADPPQGRAIAVADGAEDGLGKKKKEKRPSTRLFPVPEPAVYEGSEPITIRITAV